MLDKLARERAFFPGPQPLLLGSLDSMDDLSILLSSDPGELLYGIIMNMKLTSSS